jgi:hypothetical protein
VEPLTFGGCPIVSAIPVSVGEAGNGTVYFHVPSYAGTVTISVLTDPDHFPELDALGPVLVAPMRPGHCPRWPGWPAASASTDCRDNPKTLPG